MNTFSASPTSTIMPSIAPPDAGVIAAVGGACVSISARWHARRPWWVEAVVWGRAMHRLRRGDRCWLHYRRPKQFPNYLVLDYLFSTRGAKLATVLAALATLDEIARTTRADAILCDVASTRISDRMLGRWGWQAHAPSLWHRNFIKRFYGDFSPVARSSPVLLAPDGTISSEQTVPS